MTRRTWKLTQTHTILTKNTLDQNQLLGIFTITSRIRSPATLILRVQLVRIRREGPRRSVLAVSFFPLGLSAIFAAAAQKKAIKKEQYNGYTARTWKVSDKNRRTNVLLLCKPATQWQRRRIRAARISNGVSRSLWRSRIPRTQPIIRSFDRNGKAYDRK